MTEFTPISAAIGGSLIGVAAVLLFQLNGRIAGISGIFFGVFRSENSERTWRLLFIAGLILGGLVYPMFSGQSLTVDYTPSLIQVAIGGVFVGLGTRLGSGCTSGHGICGIARLSVRSLAATVVFLLVGMFVATSLHGWFSP